MSGSLPDGLLATAPQLLPPVFTRQRWSDLLFVHWPVDPGAVAALFPPATRPGVWARFGRPTALGRDPAQP